jgi:hypothetical protein
VALATGVFAFAAPASSATYVKALHHAQDKHIPFPIGILNLQLNEMPDIRIMDVAAKL